MSEPVVTSTSSSHSVPMSKPHPHSVAHETVPPESRPIGREEHATTGPDDKPPGAPEGEDYPPQKHAGAVGYGPHYAEVRGNEAGFEAKLIGFKEELKGKLTRNPDLVQRGHDRITGELKAKQQAEVSVTNIVYAIVFINAFVPHDRKTPSPPLRKKEGEDAADKSTPAPPNAPNSVSAEKTAPQ